MSSFDTKLSNGKDPDGSENAELRRQNSPSLSRVGGASVTARGDRAGDNGAHETRTAITPTTKNSRCRLIDRIQLRQREVCC
jgi:hypothetical protein